MKRAHDFKTLTIRTVKQKEPNLIKGKVNTTPKSVVKDEERITKDENLSTVGMMTVKSESMTYSSRVDSLVEKLSQVK